MRRWARCSGSRQLRVEPGHLQGTVDPEQDLDPPMLTEEELVWSEVALWGGGQDREGLLQGAEPLQIYSHMLKAMPGSFGPVKMF